jgi:hypothetical protein
MEDSDNIVKLYVFSILDEYDKNVSGKKQTDFNPYIDKISIGKNKYMPTNIQQQIIYEWTKIKNNFNNQHQEDKYDRCIDCKKENINSNDNIIQSYLETILCIFIIFFILYLMSRCRIHFEKWL